MDTRVVLTAIMPDNLRLVTRSTISDTKKDTTTTTLLATILLPLTETVLDVWNTQCFSTCVHVYPQKSGAILHMYKQSILGHSSVAWLRGYIHVHDV